MKLVMDEKLKHRLIGVAVIISLGAIFAPAIFRKSTHNLENINVRIAVPPKPSAPNVAIRHDEDLFKTIKIAKVDLSDDLTVKQASEIAQAERLSSELPAAPQVAKTDLGIKAEPLKIASNDLEKKAILKTITKVVPQPKSHAVLVATYKMKPKTAAIRPAPSLKKDAYTVQLASFSKLANAQELINRLQAKGYKANLTKISGRQGLIYKVSVGKASNKNSALQLKNQLASVVRLNGFVVNTGIS
ncbi:MAG: SPOR domain-containing protein [Legionella sp.]|nr:SPOR domain-containing protein [Legionella sp.]